MIDIIAEIGSSHAGDRDRALRMIRDSAEAGATTVKFQLFTADDLWRYGSPQYFIASRYEVGLEWLPDLVQSANGYGLEFLCTPFSPEAVDALEKVGVKRYKVSSGDITYTALLQAVADTRKPVLLSVGYSTWEEIDTALGILRGKDTNLPITLMHSTGAFPTEPADSRIKRILALVQRYGMSTFGEPLTDPLEVGISAHWRAWWLSVACIPYGITTIEHHVDNKNLSGPEGRHSLTFKEFGEMVKCVRDVESAIAGGEDLTDHDLMMRRVARRDPSDWLRPMLNTNETT